MNETNASPSHVGIKLVSVVIIAATIIASTFIIRGTKFYVNNIGSTGFDNDEILNTIAVSGEGEVITKPDMAIISVSISETATTSTEAQTKVNEKIKTITDRAKANDVAENDITTTGISIQPEYEYTMNGQPRIVGQRASQSLQITMKKMDDKAQKAAKLIDEIAPIENITIGGIRFDLENKENVVMRAREAAFNQAETKAKELAKLAGVSIIKPVNIKDTDISAGQPILYNTREMALDGIDKAAPTEISTGELTIRTRIDVLFGIE
jgi:uncharacterized protein